MIKNLIIAASWESSRLRPYTNYIPKIMLNLGKKPAILYIIDYWLKQWVEEILIIIHSKYIQLLSDYLHLFYKDDVINHIKFSIKDECNWSADAVLWAVKNNENFQKNVMISWCDIFPKKDLKIDNWNQSICFLTNEWKCRYWYNHELNGIVKNSDNNWDVIGLYYVNDLSQYLDKYELWQDLVDVIKNYDQWINLDFIDYWDLEKLEKTKVIFNDFARDFNSLEILDKKYVHKEALNEKWKTVIKQEINAYKEYYKYENIRSIFPKIYPSFEETGFFMNYINWREIRKVFDDLDAEWQRKLIDAFDDTLKELHKNKVDVDRQRRYDMCYEEYVWKIEKRINSIKKCIIWFDKISKVNWVDVMKFDEIMSKLKEWLNSYVDNAEFTIVHWDCTFSNSMLDENWRVILIDPRGKFWEFWVVWDKNYDIAKFIYSTLTCYDKFNLGNFSIDSIGDDEIIYKKESYDNKIISYIEEKYLNKDTQIILWIIWLWLAEYIKNDFLKMNWSYWEWLKQLSLALNS